jgi:membrane-bound metal-dependent hydrolase YbcI (DUF457 family)
MFIGHIAVALAGKRMAPSVSLATWLASVQLVDLLWPLFLLTGLEHVRVAPGITRFTPLDFYDYPITHSLIGAVCWAVLFGGGWMIVRRNTRVAALLAAGVVSHWVLDAISPRPDMPVLELTMFAGAIAVYVRHGGAGRRRTSFWLLMAFLLVIYFAASFGPPPPDTRTLALSALAAWLLVPWAWFADR